jgi:predicted N-acetyltransferase YhbS
MNLELRVMGEPDLSSVDQLLRQAYNNPHDFTLRLRRQLALQPDGWLVAEHDGTIVGCGGVTVMGPVGYVGLVGVDPALQRQGVGVMLMRALLALLESQGCATILLDASDAGKPLYLRLGFVIDDGVSTWLTSEAQPALARDAQETIATMPYQASDLSAIIAFDSAGYGAPRDRIITAYLNDAPALTRVARDESGALLGYLTLFSDIGFIGPWLASSPLAAAALLHDTLVQHGALVEGVVIPDANLDGARLLRAAGFAPVRTLAHMRLGAPLSPTRRQRVYSQINLALG